MSKFYVGQRVLVNANLGSIDGAHGKEATIVALGIPGAEYGRRYIGAQLDFGDSGHWVYEYHELTTVNDGRDVADWSACVWQPSKVTP